MGGIKLISFDEVTEGMKIKMTKKAKAKLTVVKKTYEQVTVEFERDYDTDPMSIFFTPKFNISRNIFDKIGYYQVWD